MKKMKQFLSVLLAAVMMLAMSTMTFAATGNDGTITVEKPVSGATYTVYKVFDLAYADANTDTVSYTFTKTADNTDLCNYLAESDGPFKLEETTVAGVYNVSLRENATTTQIVSAISGAIQKNLLAPATAEKTAETADSEVKFIGLDYGYYYITSTTGAVVSLTSTTKDATIVDKNYIPFDKEVDDHSVEVGQNVTFTIRGEVPDYTSFESYLYQISDTMSEGLTFNQDIKVEVNNKTLTEDTGYTISSKTARGFTLAIDVMGQKMTPGAPIVVTYTARVNEKAVSVISKNKAVLKYSNDPLNSDSHKEITDEEELYSAKIVVDKYETGNERKKLANAKFVLYRYALAGTADNETTYSFVDTTGAAVTEDTDDAVKVYYKATTTTTDENTVLTKIEWVASQTDATEYSTNSTGAANFSGLEDGDYYLLETAAPDGYNLLTDPVAVTIRGKDAVTTNLSALTVTAQITNTAGSLLPSTGGMGTTIFYILGAVLVVGAGVILVVRRRMSAEK